MSAGDNPPKSINIVIEIPEGSSVKYETDLESGTIFVDRFLHTATYYPFNYGFIPKTMGTDGDPIDALVLCQDSVYPMSVIRSRPIGVLLMEDENGDDPKIIAVPNRSVDPFYADVKSAQHLPEYTKNQIEHFFEHYKESEPNKFVKIKGWGSVDLAHRLITKAMKLNNPSKMKKISSKLGNANV